MIKKMVISSALLSSLVAFCMPLPSDFDVSLNPQGVEPGTIILPLQGYPQGVVQPDEKVLVLAPASSGVTLSVMRVWPNGQLDDSFGFGGVASVTGYAWMGFIDSHAIALQLDGKIIVVGHDSGPDVIVVARLNSNGTMDGSFGFGGIATIAGITGSTCSVAVQSDGKVVVGSEKVSTSEMIFARLNNNGSPDVSFGVGGVATVPTLTGVISSIALQSDGKIVVTWNDNVLGAIVARLTTTGSLDLGFGAGGVAVIMPLGSIYGLSVQSNGSIVASGYDSSSGSLFFARLTELGVLDGSFGSGGIALLLLTGLVSSHVVQPDGRIVGVGYYLDNFDYFIIVVRLTSSGALDTTFSPLGYTTFQIGGAASLGYGVALQADGKIVVIGSDATNNIALARLYGDAQPPLPPVPFDQARAQVAQRDGKLVVVGYAYDGIIGRFAAARVSGSTGVFDMSFNSTGKQTITIGSDAQAYAVTVNKDAKILIAGYAIVDGVKMFAVAQLTHLGQLDTFFGTGGITTIPIGTEAEARGISVLSNGTVLVGGYAVDGGMYKFALASLLPDGTLNESFGDEGTLTFSIGSYSLGNSLSAFTDDKAIMSGYGYDGNGKFALAKLCGTMKYATPLPSYLNYDPCCNINVVRPIVPAGSLDQTFNPAGVPAGTELISFEA